MNKITLYIRILLIGISLLALGAATFMAYNHIGNRGKTNNEASNESTVIESGSEEEEVQNQFTVYTVGDHTFKSDENITFEKIELANVNGDSSPLYLLVHEDFMTEENQSFFNDLAENGHSILFYNEEINPEDVVMYFDAKIMVVDMQSTVPLSFQAYGISTLNEQFIPLMIQTTSTSEIEVDAIYNLFNQLENLN